MHRSEVPVDHTYFRSFSQGYQKYLEECGVYLVPLQNGFSGWMKHFFGRSLQLAKFERLDIEPDLDTLRRNGFKRGMVIWIPYRNTSIAPGWRKLWFSTHFMKTGFTELVEGYEMKWNSRARRAKKRYLASGAVIESIDYRSFSQIFIESKAVVPHKSTFVRYHASLARYDEPHMNNWICRYNGEVVAGLATYDYDGVSSVHIVAFITEKWKAIQSWTGLIDHWFADSLRKWHKYINFDHLRDSSMTPDQQGYTTFKMNFIDHVVEFPDSYFRFI